MSKVFEEPIQADKLTIILIGELFKALGFSKFGLFSKMVSPLVRSSIHRFSKLATGFDQRIEKIGFQAASRWILPNFIEGMNVSGENSIPRKGPLLVASNHPGAYDALVIAANIPRDDLKIIVNIPLDFITNLPNTLPHFLYAPPDPFIRMNVVRSCLQHLNNGGALLIFASGGMDPDPLSMQGAEDVLKNWSRSLEIFIRRIPTTQLVITLISGILSPKYVNHLYTNFRKDRPDKQRISEFFQVMRQMRSPGVLQQTPTVTFSNPLTAAGLINQVSPSSTMDFISGQAKNLLSHHRLLAQKIS